MDIKADSGEDSESEESYRESFFLKEYIYIYIIHYIYIIYIYNQGQNGARNIKDVSCESQMKMKGKYWTLKERGPL